MKYFAVSDIHGHASILKEALEGHGFDKNNPDHLLIVCGDCFDRGKENKATYAYLKSIPNKVIIRGNHEEMLVKVIERGSINLNNIYNGTDITAEEFFGAQNVGKNGEITMSYYRKKQLLDFVNGTIDYYETENYVFVHGWVPERADWRQATAEEWSRARWTGWCDVKDKSLAGKKTVVCGHRATYYAAGIDRTRRGNDYGIYFGEGFTAIDGCTVKSKTVNVLVVDDEPMESRTHSMKLRRKFFDLVAKGKKTVEMRLFDEKRREIRVGDKIEFAADDCSGDTFVAAVEGAYVYPSFDGLAYGFPPASLGFPKKDPEYIKEYMTGIYDKESIRKYGTVAIKLRVEK